MAIRAKNPFMTDTVYRDYTQQALNNAYDQRAWAGNAMAIMESWRTAIPQREAMGCQVIAYGPGKRQRLDIFPLNKDASGDSPAVVHFHVHGGGWRLMTKEDATFIAPAQQAADLITIIPDFDLLPGVTLTEQFAQVLKAFVKAFESLSEYGGDPNRIIVSGHSSGAHLAALLAQSDLSEFGLPTDAIKSLLLISGPFDLEPVLLSARSEYIQLDADAANTLNPFRHAHRINCPCELLYGEHESPEFVRQSLAMTERLQSLAKPATCTMIPGVNHFEIMTGLGDPSSPVFQALERVVAHVRSAV